MVGINLNMAKDDVAKKEMGWLYSSPQVDREQYLLGKKIDRQVDPLLASEDREKQALASGPGALFIGSDSAGTADIAAKIKEDPLFLIKKKEEEARKQLASNPVKMKQLQQLLAKEKSSKHKSKKKRDRSPHKSQSPSRKSRKSHKEKRKSPLPQSSATSSHHHTSTTRHHHSPTKRRPHHSPTKRRPHHSRLSHEELEKRRNEMMADAESHGRDREYRLRRLEHEHRKEEEASHTHHEQDFLQPLRVESMTAASSVEERIHRSISSVQRTHAAMDKHFLRK